MFDNQRLTSHDDAVGLSQVTLDLGNQFNQSSLNLLKRLGLVSGTELLTSRLLPEEIGLAVQNHVILRTLNLAEYYEKGTTSFLMCIL